MSDVRAAIFDLDDTLAESWQPMDARMGTLLSSLSKKMPVAVITGTSRERLIRQFLPGLPADANRLAMYLLPSNAAECYSWGGTEWTRIYAVELSDDERKQVVEALENAVRETGVLSNTPQFGVRIEQRVAGVAFAAVGVDASAEEKSAWDPDRRKRERLCAALTPMLPDFNIFIGGRATIDITRKGVDKAYGVRWLAEHLSLSASQMLYVGDAFGPGGNDEVVVPTGIQTRSTSGLPETEKIIEELLSP